ncbi:hypothetical protein [Photorhabdus asymbiotica]|uniref:hypothetical protein n=1 Tax=Photorhabdus asymbiotica TaxID=291112 RepID=UPI001474A28C|nr:hypothetical protein [Photorhabdus asymbiotica]
MAIAGKSIIVAADIVLAVGIIVTIDLNFSQMSPTTYVKIYHFVNENFCKYAILMLSYV